MRTAEEEEARLWRRTRRRRNVGHNNHIRDRAKQQLRQRRAAVGWSIATTWNNSGLFITRRGWASWNRSRRNIKVTKLDRMFESFCAAGRHNTTTTTFGQYESFKHWHRTVFTSVKDLIKSSAFICSFIIRIRILIVDQFFFFFFTIFRIMSEPLGGSGHNL